VAGSSNNTVLNHLSEPVDHGGDVPDLRSDLRRASHYCAAREHSRSFPMRKLLTNCNGNINRRAKQHSSLLREGERVYTARQVSKIHHAPLVTLRDTVQNSGPAITGETHARRSHPREEYHQNIVSGGKSELCRIEKLKPVHSSGHTLMRYGHTMSLPSDALCMILE